MTDTTVQDRYSNRLLGIITAILLIAALRIGFAVIMPIAFAAIIVAMTFWIWVWGMAGALIAVPLTAAIVIICGQFDRSRWIAKLLSS